MFSASLPAKKMYNNYIQKNLSAYTILLLSIDRAILTDVCTKSTVKEIWDYYSDNKNRKVFFEIFAICQPDHLKVSQIQIYQIVQF